MSDDFEFITGKTQDTYDDLKPGESRTFQYKIKSIEAGKFWLPQANATFQDEGGNYHKLQSNVPTVEVIASIVDETPTSEETSTPTATTTAAVEEDSPGFEFVFAIMGVLAALFVVRRMKK